MKRLIATLIGIILGISLFAQQTVQPKIMVIPYTKDGEDIRTILENDVNTNFKTTKINKAELDAIEDKGFEDVPKKVTFDSGL